MLERLVFTKEMWSAAISGRSFEESDDTSLAGLRARIERAGDESRRWLARGTVALRGQSVPTAIYEPVDVREPAPA